MHILLFNEKLQLLFQTVGHNTVWYLYSNKNFTERQEVEAGTVVLGLTKIDL